MADARMRKPFWLVGSLSLSFAAACSEGTGPSDKYPLDKAVEGTWTGAYALGSISLRVYPVNLTDSWDNFRGEAEFTVTTSGATMRYPFAAIGHAENLICNLRPANPDQYQGSAMCSAKLTSPNEMFFKWWAVESSSDREVLGISAEVILTRR